MQQQVCYTLPAAGTVLRTTQRQPDAVSNMCYMCSTNRALQGLACAGEAVTVMNNVRVLPASCQQMLVTQVQPLP